MFSFICLSRVTETVLPNHLFIRLFHINFQNGNYIPYKLMRFGNRWAHLERSCFGCIGVISLLTLSVSHHKEKYQFNITSI